MNRFYPSVPLGMERLFNAGAGGQLLYTKRQIVILAGAEGLEDEGNAVLV